MPGCAVDVVIVVSGPDSSGKAWCSSESGGSSARVEDVRRFRDPDFHRTPEQRSHAPVLSARIDRENISSATLSGSAFFRCREIRQMRARRRHCCLALIKPEHPHAAH